MCVAAIAWQAHPRWRLVAVANRDEHHVRPTAPLARWEDASGIIAGRDLSAGGTWLGVSEAGRFALVTNFRVPEGPQPGRPSRGGLVTGLLLGEQPQGVAAMNPFNLFLVDSQGAHFLTNHPRERRELLAPGIHGLSNGAFEHPWPKTSQLGHALADWLGDAAHEPEHLFTALRAETPDALRALPGHGPEPVYAPVFIRNPVYGTRCSTLVLVDDAGAGRIVERRFSPDGAVTGETALDFRWTARSPLQA